MASKISTLRASGVGTVGDDQPIRAIFDGDVNYEPSETDTIAADNTLAPDDETDIRKHYTNLTINDIPNVARGTPFTVTGVLIDLNQTAIPGSFSGSGNTTGKLITFTEIFQGGAADLDTLGDILTEGVVFNNTAGSSLTVLTCMDVDDPETDALEGSCSEDGKKLLRIDDNTSIVFDQNRGINDNEVANDIDVRGVNLEIEELAPLETISGISIDEVNSPTTEIDGAAPISALYGTFSSFGIEEINFADTTGVTASISSVELWDAGNPVTLREFDFSELIDGSIPTPFILGDGTYFQTANSDNSFALQGKAIDVVATFSEDDDYFGEDATDSYSTTHNSALAGAAGSGTFTLIPDSNVGFSSFGTGVDIDGDSILNVWERPDVNPNRGIDFGAGGVLEKYLLQLPIKDESPYGIANRGFKDIYVEIDYMEGHKPDIAAMESVIQTFIEAPIANVFDRDNQDIDSGIRLHLDIDDAIPHVRDLSVWTDDDNDLTNDFNSLKARFFGNSTERSTLGTAQANGGVGSCGATTAGECSVTIDGLTLSTPVRTSFDGDQERQKGTVTVTQKVQFNHDVILSTDGFKPSWDDLGIVGISSSDPAQQPIFLQLGGRSTAAGFKFDNNANPILDTWIITTKFKWVAPEAVTTEVVDTVTSKFAVLDSVTLLPDTTAQITSVTTGSNSPIMTTNLLNAKAQVYHYFIWAHSIGDCGPSGMAEGNGNDGVVALGCNWGSNAEPDPDGGGPLTAFVDDRDGFLATSGSQNDQAGTFMHELGHNLGLRHGGPLGNPDAEDNCKPNYQSVMSYSRQTDRLLGNNFILDYSVGQMASIDETSLTDTAGLVRTVFAGSIADNVPAEPAFTDNPLADPPNIDNRRVMVVGTPTAGVGNEVISGIATVPAASVPAVFTIDWDGDETDDSGTFDVNKIALAGCSGQNNDRTVTNDYNDWDAISFDFRGAAQSSFDGLQIVDPIDIGGDELDGILASLDHFEPNKPKAFGDETQGTAGHFKLKFTLSTCDPDLPTGNPDCDIVQLKQDGDFFVDDLDIRLQMKQLNGTGANNTRIFPPVPEHFALANPGLNNTSAQFLSTGNGEYEIEIDLDTFRKGFATPSAAAGNWALYYTIVTESFGLLIFDDDNVFSTCDPNRLKTLEDGTQILQDDNCENVITTNEKYSGRLVLEDIPETPAKKAPGGGRDRGGGPP